VRAIQFRTVRRAIDEYNGILRAQGQTHAAYAQLDHARLEADRAQELLKEAHKVHKTDKLHRDIALLDAEERLRQMKHEAKLAKMEREAEMQHAIKASTQEEHVMGLTDDERELVDAMLAKMKPDRYRAILEKAIKDQNLSAADEERARQIMEELINRSL
jgi:hypothetical protein